MKKVSSRPSHRQNNVWTGKGSIRRGGGGRSEPEPLGQAAGRQWQTLPQASFMLYPLVSSCENEHNQSIFLQEACEE